MRVIAEGRRRQPLTSDPQLTSEQGGSRKLGGEVSSTDSLSKNTESVQMVSEGGKLVPRIIPSVRQIEKTKPKRLNDPVSKPSEDSLSSEGNSADKSGGRRGRSGGVGWRKDLDESEQKEYESHPPGVRKDKYPPHVSTNDVIFKETRNSAGNSSDGLGSIVEEDTTLAEERLKYVSSGKFNADSAIGTSGKLVAVPKKASPDEPTAAASRTFVQPRAPVNYGELRKEIEDLKAEMNELKAAKRSRADSVDNARLQPLSSQPLNARGLVSPTFQNNVSNDARKQRKYLTENSDLENKPVYNVSSQIRDAKLSSSGSFASSLQGDGVVQSNTKESLTGNPPGNNSKTAMVRDTKYSFSSIATKQNAGTHEFANRALNPALGENVSNEKKNNETKPISRLESKPNLGGNPQRFDQSLNRSKRWPTNSPTTPLHVAARRRKAISQRRANANRNPNASDKAIEVAWKKNKRKQGDGCARRALRRMMTARSSSFILLPFHFILAAFFVLYLMVGTLIIVMGSEGRVGAWHWAAVSGNAPLTGDQPLSVHDPPGRALVRQEVLEKVMDMAVEAVLVRSKREVLKNIFNSPDMQAAFRAHQETGYQSLPSDDTIRAISDDITRRWRDDLSAVLTRNDFIADLYTLGYQVSVSEMFDFLSPYKPLPPAISWDHPSAMLHAFTLVSTMGGGARTGGSIRGFVVAYAIFGVLLYYWTVNVWSRRITDTLVRLSQICFTSTREDNPQARQSQEHRARALALWFTLLLVLGAWLGLCPVGVGTPRANYGERLESATMALLLVRPPYPLPQTMESVAILASCITCSHCFILSLLSQVTVACVRWAQHWLHGGAS